MLATHPYASVLVLILVILAIVTGMLGMSFLLGPKRRGPVKDDTYEAGMPTIGDARGRFNVRFYVVAMMFLLFDVEIVLLWPWVLVLYDVRVKGDSVAQATTGMHPTMLFGSIVVFFVILVVGYVYDWGKGVFRWLA